MCPKWWDIPGVTGRLDKWFGELLDELFDDSGPVLLSVWWRWFSVSLLLLLLFLVELDDWWLLASLLVKLLLFVWMELLFRLDDMARPFGINALWWWWWCIAKWLWCKLGGSEAIAAQWERHEIKHVSGWLVFMPIKKLLLSTDYLNSKMRWKDEKRNESDSWLRT